MKSINFLREKILISKKKSRRLFLLRTWASLALVIYLLLIGAVFALYFLAKKTNQVVAEKIEQEKKVIESLRPIETKQVYLATKTKSLSGILASKKQHQVIVESVLNLLPEGVGVSDFGIADDGSVNFSGTCSSFAALKEFLDTLQLEEETGFLKIKEAQIGSIGYALEGDYNFEVTIVFYLGET